MLALWDEGHGFRVMVLETWPDDGIGFRQIVVKVSGVEERAMRIAGGMVGCE